MVDGKLGVLRVIEGRAGPCRGVMAVLARSWEELWLRRVAWITRLVVIRLMAADTRGGQRRVVVVHMTVATHAWRHHVRAGERESCVVVIES